MDRVLSFISLYFLSLYISYLSYITGILLYTNQMTEMTAFFIRLFGGFTGF
ncbi:MULTISPECIES: hypothetical protein [Bacillus cereus group]|uniref:hypothetical protein n=1 Tax=Bacillus cereus group TaxID=86661 RepID=UPI001594B0E6|nr:MULTISPECIES: hypothetical protein [Bacillus cereus group]UPJ19327.1 hypothetical protein MYW48_08435 [Bacillus cereus]